MYRDMCKILRKRLVHFPYFARAKVYFLILSIVLSLRTNGSNIRQIFESSIAKRMPQEKIDYARIAQLGIEELVTEFARNPFNFFSESDAKCRLFNTLFEYKEINQLRRTADDKLIHPLHSEVSYFNRYGKLLHHIDLSAVEPEDTDVYSSPSQEGLRLSKGYSAPECAFAIELKLNKHCTKAKMLSKWENDMSKLDDILRRNPGLACFCILLDKKNRISSQEELADLGSRHPAIKMAYSNASGKVFSLNF